MQKVIATLLFLGGVLVSFGQYDPAFSEFYRTEIEQLKSNYEKEDVKLDLVILYNDWLGDIKKEKASLSDQQSDPVVAQKLEDLGNLEEQVINEMTGKTPQPKEELPIAEMEDSTMLAGGMPDSLTAEVEESVEEPGTAAEPVIEEPELAVAEEPNAVEEVKEDFNETENSTASTTSSASFAELLTSEIPGVYYRVQVFASAKPTAGADVAGRLSLKEEIVEEQHNGLYKYLVGKFSIYASAKARAEELKANTGVEAFVVGYKQEKRTSLSDIFGY